MLDVSRYLSFVDPRVRYNMIQSTLVSLKRNAFVRKRLLKKRKNRRLFLSKRKSPTNIIVYSCTPRCVYLCLCICVCVCVCIVCAFVLVRSCPLMCSIRSASSGPPRSIFLGLSSILHFRCPLTARVQQRIVQSLDH